MATLSNWVASIQWNSGATNDAFPICFQGPRFFSASPRIFVFLALLHLYVSMRGISKDTSVGLVHDSCMQGTMVSVLLTTETSFSL